MVVCLVIVIGFWGFSSYIGAASITVVPCLAIVLGAVFNIAIANWVLKKDLFAYVTWQYLGFCLLLVSAGLIVATISLHVSWMLVGAISMACSVGAIVWLVYAGKFPFIKKYF